MNVDYYHHNRSARRHEVLDVACPICDSQPGQHCHDIGGKPLVDRPHVYRAVVAQEEARR